MAENGDKKGGGTTFVVPPPFGLPYNQVCYRMVFSMAQIPQCFNKGALNICHALRPLTLLDGSFKTPQE